DNQLLAIVQDKGLLDADQQKISDIYQSFINEARRDQLGTSPIKARLDDIATVTDKAELAALMGQLPREGLNLPFRLQVGPDMREPGRNVIYLTQAGLLHRNEQGNQVRYRANIGHPLFSDLATLFRKTHGIVPALREALAPLGSGVRLALVFGSVARGTQTAASDVDLLVLGTVGFVDLVQALFPLHAALGREVNPVLYTPEQFAGRVASGDAFAREVLAKPQLFVKGGANELAELAGDRPAAGASS
ncbi:MAG: hypothetical protein EOO27_41570, partial [Comamonadaceae bacterium]